MKSFLEWSPGPWAISLLIKRMLARDLKSLEYDPKVQYRFHQSFMFFWLISMIIVLFIPAFDQLGTRLIMEVSLYANFSTDFGAMTAALAAGNYHCEHCELQNKAVVPTPAEPAAVDLPHADF